MIQKNIINEKSLILYSTADMLGSQYQVDIQTSGLLLKDVNQKQEQTFTFSCQVGWRLSKLRSDCLSEIIIGSSSFYGTPQTLLTLRKLLSNLVRFTNFEELYDKGQTIASTLYGEVFQSTDKISKLKSATKVINKKKLWVEYKRESKTDCQKIADILFTQEVNILRTMKNPLIVDLIEVFEDEQSYYLVFEYLRGGCLDDMFSKINIPTYQVIIIIKKILEAVKFMHQNEIAHRDLKPRNIMFSRENDITSLKIIDFGLAVSTKNSNFLVIQCGTPGYTAPEIFRLKRYQKRYDKVCDIFSVGAILYKMLRNEELFDAPTRQEVSRLNQICNLKNLKGINYGTSRSEQAEDLILQMLQVDPSKRISADQALNHEFLQRKLVDFYIEDQDSYQSNGRSTMFDLSLQQNAKGDPNEYKTDEEHYEMMEYLIEDECVKVNQIFVSQKHL